MTTLTYRPLGKCGAKVSHFGLGGWTTFGGSVTDETLIERILTHAFEAGINFFDIADIYSKGQAEIEMGRVLREFPRHNLVISSKVFFPMSDDINDRGLSRKHIMESIDKSLRRIDTDYLDIYFCHRYDDDTPLEETARAMSDLVRQGKILYWGTSQWSSQQLRQVHKLCKEQNLYPPQVEQPEFSLLARKRFESEIRPALEDTGMGAVTWSPLASGVLTAKYSNGLPQGSRLSRIDWLREGRYTEENVKKADQLLSIAHKHGYEASQLALAWAAAQPGVSSVILGVSRLEQLEDNLSALAVKLTSEINRELDLVFS